MSQKSCHPDLMVILGATGDLTCRKVLFALYRLCHEVPREERLRILGAAKLP